MNEFVASPVVAPVSPQQVHQQDQTAELEFPEVEPDVNPEEESALCTVCLFPNFPDVPWCKRCGAPIGPTAGFVPTEAIFSVGYAFRAALRGRPKPLVVFGIWLFFFPGFVVNTSLILGFLLGRVDSVPRLLSLWLAVIGVVICGSMLYRVTRNYLCSVEKAPMTPPPLPLGFQ
jgi:hypothetical protein